MKALDFLKSLDGISFGTDAPKGRPVKHDF